jgi:hypothetical protein
MIRRIMGKGSHLGFARGLKGIGRTVAGLWMFKHRLAALCFSMVAKTLGLLLLWLGASKQEIHIERFYHIYQETHV